MRAEQIAKTLGGASRSGSNWSCKCPAHDDRRSSLSVMDGEKGLVVHCHAGCSQDDVINALKIEQLWPTSRTEPPKSLPPPVQVNIGSGKGRIVSTYDYTDEHGQLLYQAVRYEPKDFRQRKPMPDGSWSWSIKDVRRVLYRLPEVLAAIAEGKPILVCEGEKDVEAARSLGMVATCNAMGADNGHGNKWFPEFGEVLTNADVIIIPDQDEPGERHADWVIQTLTGKAKSIRVAVPKSGKDFADWIAADPDLTLDEILKDAFDVTEGFEAEKPNLTKFEFVDVSDLVADIKPVNWVVRDYLERDSIALVYGPPGGGKSFLSVDLACSVATDTEWMGHKVHPGSVFYIAGEGHNGLARRFRAWEIARAITIPKGALFKSAGAMQVLDEQSALEASETIAALVESTGNMPSLVVIDTLARNFGSGDENSTSDMSKFIQHVDTYIRSRFKCCVLLVHHSGHNAERARGSSALKAAVDAEYEISKDDSGNVRVRTTTMNDAEIPPDLLLKLKGIELDGVLDEDGAPVTSAVLDIADDLVNSKVAERGDGSPIFARDVLLILHRGWIPSRALGEALDASEATARKAVEILVRYGFVAMTGNGRSKKGEITPEGLKAVSLTGAFLTQKDKPFYKRGNDD